MGTKPNTNQPFPFLVILLRLITYLIPIVLKRKESNDGTPPTRFMTSLANAKKYVDKSRTTEGIVRGLVPKRHEDDPRGDLNGTLDEPKVNISLGGTGFVVSALVTGIVLFLQHIINNPNFQEWLNSFLIGMLN